MPARGIAAVGVAIRFDSLLLSAVAQPLVALLPYGCGTPLAGAALESERKCSVITCYRWHNIAASAAKPPRQTIESLYKSKVDGDCVRLTNRRQSDSEDRSKSNRLATPNAETPRAGIPIPEAQRPFEPETANLKPFSRGIKRGILSFVKESIPLLFAPPCLQGTLFLHRMWKSLTPWCDRTKRPRGGSARCRWRTLSHSAYPGARCG